MLLDPKGTGAPDLLAGADTWSVSDDMPKSLLNFRGFQMTLGTRLLWEWVGPTAGLLVVTKDGKTPIGIIAGDQLVGTTMGGHRWENSFQALSYFDKDGDKKVYGAEMGPLYLWVDTNVDGLIDPKEITPAGDTFASLSTLPASLNGAIWSEGGGILRGGKQTTIWDWNPSARIPSVDAGGHLIPVVPSVYISPEEVTTLPAPVVYQWVQPSLKAFGLYRFFKVGTSLWVATLGPDFEKTGVMSVGEVFIDPPQSEGGPRKVTWGVSDGAHTWVRVEGELSPSGDLKGTVNYGGDVLPLEAYQAKPPFEMDPAVSSVFALPDSAFQEAILGHFPNRIIVPFGLHFSGAAGERALIDL
jgi:hypothetical protein